MKQTLATRKARTLAPFLFVAIVLLCPNPPAALAAPARQGQIHTVQPGETLSSIAARYGVSLSAIMQANGISNANVIYVGQRLTIPAGGSGTDQSRAATNGSRSDYSSGSAGICDTYTVRLGDNLSTIALRYGVTVESIRQANGLWGSFIWPRLTLKIPCSATYLPSLERNPVYQPTPYEEDCPLTADRYQVRSGDTLARIARRCGVSAQAIREMNGLRSDTIYIGQWLTIRGPGRATAMPTSHYAPPPIPTFTPTPTWVWPEVTPTATPTPARSDFEVFPTPQGW